MNLKSLYFNYLAKKYVNLVTETGFNSFHIWHQSEIVRYVNLRDIRRHINISTGTVGMSNCLGLFRLL